MQSEITGHVSKREWQWVILIASTLSLIAFLPFVLVLLRQTTLNPNWEFMGALHWYQDAAANMSRIVQGTDGNWLMYFMHTPDAHRAALIQPIYALLGHVSRLTVQSPSLIFHVARIFAAFVMYLAIYQLGASIWLRVRTRRIFFVIVALGSGFGWIYALLTALLNGQVVPDLMLPQGYPFYAALVNVHYPLGIAAMALLASFFIPVFRPGENKEPSVNNEALPAFLLSLVLVFVYPDALLPMGLAFSGSIIARWVNRRTMTLRGWRWGLWVLVPALPVVTYYIITLINNPAVLGWIQQRGDWLPSVIMLVLGLGLPLILALPGIWRALREFQPDGDRFMLLWLVAMLLLGYAPLELQTSFWLGLMLPIGYFAARGMEDFWFDFLRRRNRRRLYVAGVLLISMSHLFILLLPLQPILQGWETVNGNVLEKGYFAAMQRTIAPRTSSQDVVLAAPDVSPWIPVWGEARVVYGSRDETLNADQRLDDVRAWYAADSPDDLVCEQMLATYDVALVVLGPRERALGEAACIESMTFIASYDGVRLYAPR